MLTITIKPYPKEQKNMDKTCFHFANDGFEVISGMMVLKDIFTMNSIRYNKNIHGRATSEKIT